MALLSFSVLVIRAAQTGAKGMLLKDLLFLDMKGIYSEVCRITFLRRVRKITKGHYWLRPVCVRPSVRMQQLDSHWTDFHES